MNEWELDSPKPDKPSAPATGKPSARSRGPGTTPPDGAVTRAAEARKAARGRWYLIAGGGLVILVAGVLSGFYVARSYSSAEAAELRDVKIELSELQKGQAQSEQRNWDYYRMVEALRAENEASDTGSAQAPDSSGRAMADAGAYGDGVYVVGEDLLPGVYDGVLREEVGYWARLSATDGSVGSILANEIVRGPFVLTVNEADFALELWGVEISPR